jgi:hypothetical protein
MTLKEKIKDVEIEKGMSDRLEQITEEFAISFAEWFINSWCLHSLSYGDITIKQSLEIYKKEKGL